jgi:hypothetical protein
MKFALTFDEYVLFLRKKEANMLQKIGLLLVFLLTGVTLKAQNAIPAGGADGSGSGGSVSFTVGQLVCSSVAESGTSVSQGVQQPFEISFAIGVEPLKGISLQCSAFPNPAIDFLILKVENQYPEKLSYKLYDSNGKILEYKRLASSETTINMGQLKPATYFLKVFQTHNSESPNDVAEFKIIKN